jgi:phosphate/sulfate permease
VELKGEGIRNIFCAWIVTFPVCILAGGLVRKLLAAAGIP